MNIDSLWKKYTSPGFLRVFSALVRLRYKLMWAQVRTDSGKIALFFGLYLLIGVFAIFMALGGLGGALAAVELGRGEMVARLMLTGLMMNGIGLSLLFGLGPSEAFTEGSLRRYPLDSQERFVIRHFIGLLDPVWLLLIAGIIGLVFGFIWFGGESVLTGIPALVLFILANYLLTVTLLTVIGLLMQTRRGATLLGALMILLLSFGPLAISSLTAGTRDRMWQVVDLCLRILPPGAAASMITGQDLLKVAGGAGLLILWCVSMFILLRTIEKKPRVSEPGRAGAIVWDNLYDQIAGIFGSRYRPMVSRSLRYHLRCNIIRFSLISSPLVILMLRYLIPGYGEKSHLSMSIAVFFILSSANGAAMMLNLFGYDGAGIRRFAVLPIRFADALKAASLASLILRGIAFLVAFTLWVIIYRNRSLTWQAVLIVLTVSVAGMIMFNGLGLWVSIFAPKRGDFEAMWNNRLSLGANIVVIGGAIIPFWVMITVMERIPPETLSRLWWAPALFLVLCVGFYGFSLKFIDIPLRSRKEKLINLLSGASDN